MTKFEYVMAKAAVARLPLQGVLLAVQFICIVGGAVHYWNVSWLLAACACAVYFMFMRNHLLNCTLGVVGAHFGMGMDWGVAAAILFVPFMLRYIISVFADAVSEFAV